MDIRVPPDLMCPVRTMDDLFRLLETRPAAGMIQAEGKETKDIFLTLGRLARFQGVHLNRFIATGGIAIRGDRMLVAMDRIPKKNSNPKPARWKELHIEYVE
jgi:hypothetical protein